MVALSRSNEFGLKFRNANYEFLWHTSLADTETLEAAYAFMKEGAYCGMPIDSNAAFGRILIMALVKDNPAKATEVFETLIYPNADPVECEFIMQGLLGGQG